MVQLNKFLWLVVLVILPQLIYSQSSHFTKEDHWKNQKRELFFGVGATNMLNDLTGRGAIDNNYQLKDLKMSMTRFNAHFGIRFRLFKFLSTKSIMTYAFFQSSDVISNEPIRRNRNIQVNTHLFEFSQHFEIIIFNNEEFGYRYNKLGVKGMKHKNSQIYLITGGSLFLYTPQSNKGVNLRPLKTEGQGLPNAKNKKAYDLHSFGIPMGLGFKTGLGAHWRMSFELTYTHTFTDYLDDVSTTYYDNDVILTKYGENASFLANPSPDFFPSWTATGNKRGNENQNDSYFYFNVSFIKNITYNKDSKPKKWKVN